jgi:hypothetical protein
MMVATVVFMLLQNNMMEQFGSTGATMGTGRGNLQSAGVGSPTASSGIAFGGATTTPPYSALTEEFTGEILTNNVKTITTS